MRHIQEDLRFGLRLLIGSPGFTAVTILTLALGVASTTTVYSWMDTLLFNPIPGARAGRELMLFEGQSSNGAIQVSYLDFRDYRDGLESISGLAVARQDVFTLGHAASPQAVWGELVSGNYFSVLGVKAIAGRLFAVEEQGDTPAVSPVAVISERLWRTRFRSDRGVVGKSLRVNRRELTIIGVAAGEFRGIVPGLVLDMWVPVTMGAELGLIDPSTFRSRANRNLNGIVRLKPGMTAQQASAEASAMARRLAAAAPETNQGFSARVAPMSEARFGAPELLAGPLRILMAVSCVVLLIVCANVGNLLIARLVTRRKEFGIRLAMGARRARLVRQLLTETVLLAAAAAVVGIPLTLWMSESIAWMIPNVGVTVVSGAQVNARFLAFVLLACALAAALAGAAPVLFLLRSDVNEILKEGGRGSAGAESQRMRALLVVCEVALAAVAVTGAGLFARSLHNIRRLDPGFERAHVLLSRFYISTGGYSGAELLRLCRNLKERLEWNPGVEGATYVDAVPLGSTEGPWHTIEVQGYVPAPGEDMNINRALISPGYFGVLRVPLKAGREFTGQDTAESEPVMIVNESFARRFFPGTSAVGRKIKAWRRWFTVVGVARDTRYFRPEEKPRPYFYAPMQQAYRVGTGIYFLVRTAGDPNQAAPLMRREAAALDPGAAAFHTVPLDDYTQLPFIPHKVAATLLAALAAIAMLLAGVGLYSVMAYSVTRRTQEIGIRMAMGAQARDVLAAVLGEVMVLTGTGLLAGAGVTLAAARIAAGMLVNVRAADPASFSAAALFLAAVALMAGYFPARRATKVDPATALRSE